MAGDELLHEAAVFPEYPVRVPRFPNRQPQLADR